MRRTVLPGHFGIGEALSHHVRGDMLEAKAIMLKFAKVEAEHLFVQIAEQVELFNANVGALQSALEQAPEVLKAVSVHATVNVAFRVVNDLVLEPLVLEQVVGIQRIGVDGAMGFDVTANLGIQYRLAAIGDDGSANLSAALQHAHDGSLILAASFSNAATALVRVHEASGTTDESLVHFDFLAMAADLRQVLFVHGEANPMQHEPSALLGDAKSAGHFVGANAILAVSHHPDSHKPLVESDGGILKDGSDFHGELPLGVLLLALPDSASRDKANILAPAIGAGDAIGPAALHHEREAVVGVGEVLDGLLKSLGLVHGVPHKQKYAKNDLLSQVYYRPYTRSPRKSFVSP